jgi:hypothetical protein
MDWNMYTPNMNTQTRYSLSRFGEQARGSKWGVLKNFMPYMQEETNPPKNEQKALERLALNHSWVKTTSLTLRAPILALPLLLLGLLPRPRPCCMLNKVVVRPTPGSVHEDFLKRGL